MGRDLGQARQRWSAMKRWQQRLLLAAAATEVTLKVGALIDIQRRPADRIRGPKWFWRSAMVVNGIGPVSYWTFGRRR